MMQGVEIDEDIGSFGNGVFPKLGVLACSVSSADWGNGMVPVEKN